MVAKARADIVYTLDGLQIGESITVDDYARGVMHIITRQMAREAERLGISIIQTGEMTFTRVTEQEGVTRRQMALIEKYKLSPLDHQALETRAGGCCEICGRERPLHIDHDHQTGDVRGLLCISCNTALGKLGDTVEGLMRAIRYLSKYGT